VNDRISKDDARIGEAIGRTFDTMASHATDVHLRASMPELRRRVAGRRAVKVSGIATATLALVCAIAVGAWAAPWNTKLGPVPPATPTPSVSPTPSPSPSPTPTPSSSPTTAPSPDVTVDPAAARTALDDPRFASHQHAFPAWGAMRGSLDNLMCGDPVSELLDLPSTSTLDLSLVDVGGQKGQVRITNTGSADVPSDYGGLEPGLVYVQDGRIVDAVDWVEPQAGPFLREDGSEVTSLAAGQSFVASALNGLEEDSGWSCGTRIAANDNYPFDTFPSARPAGRYDVYAVTIYEAHNNGSAPLSFLVGGKISVTVPDAPSLTDSRFAAGAALPFGDSVGEGLVCGADASKLFSFDDAAMRLGIVGDVTVSASGTATALVRFTSLGGVSSGYAAGDPILVWSQGGKVVDASFWPDGGGGGQWTPAESWNADGTKKSGAPTITSLAAGQSFETIAASGGGWHCGTQVPSDGPSPSAYPDTLPPGQYHVRALAWCQDPNDTVGGIAVGKRYLASDPVTVTIPG